MATRRSSSPRADPGPIPDGAHVVYTDGACKGNPGPGGWAWALAPDGRVWRSGAEAWTTNQQMEIQAALEALRAFPSGSLVVVTDSTYVANCFRDRWYVKWQSNEWRNSQKRPVANVDRWKPLIERYLAEPGRVQFRWVKGHSTDPLNILVDRLAVEAAHRQLPAAGDPPPQTSSTVDPARSAASADASDPESPTSLF